jgi:hypothetical protein
VQNGELLTHDAADREHGSIIVASTGRPSTNSRIGARASDGAYFRLKLRSVLPSYCSLLDDRGRLDLSQHRRRKAPRTHHPTSSRSHRDTAL